MPRSSSSRWCCWAVVSLHSCTELCSLHPLSSFSEEALRSRKMAKQSHESSSRKHLAGQSLLQSFVSTITLYFPLPLRFHASQLVFLFKQLSTPDGRVGGGGGTVKGRKGTSRGSGGGGTFWNMRCGEKMPDRSAEVGREERAVKASSYHMCARTYTQSFQHTIKIEKETFWFP